ncbi:hypothetical protein J3F84DRAFT_369014 [Trichoderma pleuroticola]
MGIVLHAIPTAAGIPVPYDGLFRIAPRHNSFAIQARRILYMQLSTRKRPLAACHPARPRKTKTAPFNSRDRSPASKGENGPTRCLCEKARVGNMHLLPDTALNLCNAGVGEHTDADELKALYACPPHCRLIYGVLIPPTCMYHFTRERNGAGREKKGNRISVTTKNWPMRYKGNQADAAPQPPPVVRNQRVRFIGLYFPGRCFRLVLYCVINGQHNIELGLSKGTRARLKSQRF